MHVVTGTNRRHSSQHIGDATGDRRRPHDSATLVTANIQSATRPDLFCLSIQVETPYYIEHRFGSTGHHHSPAIQFGGWTDQLDTEWGSQTLRQACYRENPKAQCAFKILMIHEVLQFALRIAFRCVLHRCGNLDIHR